MTAAELAKKRIQQIRNLLGTLTLLRRFSTDITVRFRFSSDEFASVLFMIISDRCGATRKTILESRSFEQLIVDLAAQLAD